MSLVDKITAKYGVNSQKKKKEPQVRNEEKPKKKKSSSIVKDFNNSMVKAASEINEPAEESINVKIDRETKKVVGGSEPKHQEAIDRVMDNISKEEEPEPEQEKTEERSKHMMYDPASGKMFNADEEIEIEDDEEEIEIEEEEDEEEIEEDEEEYMEYEGCTGEEECPLYDIYVSKDIGRIALSDPILGVKTFSTTMDVIDGLVVDEKSCNELLKYALKAVVTSLTPYFFIKLGDLKAAFNSLSNVDFNEELIEERFLFVSTIPTQYIDDNNVILVYVITDAFVESWNFTLKWMFDKLGIKRSMTTIVHMVSYLMDWDFGAQTSEEEFMMLKVDLGSKLRNLMYMVEGCCEPSDGSEYTPKILSTDEIRKPFEDIRGVDHDRDPFRGDRSSVQLHENERHEGETAYDGYRENVKMAVGSSEEDNGESGDIQLGQDDEEIEKALQE